MTLHYTQKLFSSRKVVDAASYVGEVGRLFYNETTGELRVSDGITIGGKPIYFQSSGNVAVGGDIAGLSNNASVIGINGVTLSTLPTGILKITTGTGDPSTASAIDINNTLGYTPVPTTRNINGYSLATNFNISAADVGLGNVDNTSDATKNSAVAALTNKTFNTLNNTFIVGNTLSVSSYRISNLGDPQSQNDAVSKSYIDNYVSGFLNKITAKIATTTALPAYTYFNGNLGVGSTITATSTGSLVIDGYTTILNDIILVKDETVGNASYNGAYTVTTAGNASTAFQLTRVTSLDESVEFAGAAVFVSHGNINLSTTWSCITSLPTVGNTAIVFAQSGASTSYLNGYGLNLIGTVFSVDNTVVPFKSDNLSVFATTSSTQLGNVVTDGTGIPASAAKVTFTFNATPSVIPSTLLGIAAGNYTFEIDIDGTGSTVYTVTATGTDTMTSIAALLQAQISAAHPGATVQAIGSGGVVTSGTIGLSSSVRVTVPAASGTDLITAINNSLSGHTSTNYVTVHGYNHGQAVFNSLPVLYRPEIVDMVNFSTSGDNFIISSDTSIFREGQWALQNSGSLYNLVGDLVMKYWTHNVSIDNVTGDFLGRDEYDPCTIWAYAEGNIEKTFYSPLAQGGITPTNWTLKREFDLNTGNLYIAGNITTTNFLGNTITQPPHNATTSLASTEYVYRHVQLAKGTVVLSGITGGIYSYYTLGSGVSINYTAAGGTINTITSIVTAGTGYKVGDLLTIDSANWDCVLRVTAIGAGGSVTGLEILYGGTGYSSGTNLLVVASDIPFTIKLNGALTSNVTISLKYGTLLSESNDIFIVNNTTGAFTVTVKVGDATNTPTGTGVVIYRNSPGGTFVQTDGATDVWPIGVSAFNGRYGNVTLTSSDVTTALTYVPVPRTAGLGTVLQTISANVAASSGTTTVVLDNTTPTITTGTEVASLIITPTAATSKIKFNGSFVVDQTNNGRAVIAFFFRNSVCIGTTSAWIQTSGNPTNLSFQFVDSPATTATTTYSIRVASTANTWYVSQSSAGARFGGTYALNTVALTELS